MTTKKTPDKVEAKAEEIKAEEVATEPEIAAETIASEETPPEASETPPADPAPTDETADPLPEEAAKIVSDPRKGSPWLIAGVYPRVKAMTDFELVQEIRGWSVVPALPDQHDLSRHEAEQYLMLLNNRAATSGPYPTWDERTAWRDDLQPHEDDWMNYPLADGIEAGLDPIDLNDGDDSDDDESTESETE